jgi:hypothetical protein
MSINTIPIKEIEKNNEFESGENEYWKYDQFLSNYYFPSYWEAIGVITPEDKDLNFAVEKRGFQIHFKR